MKIRSISIFVILCFIFGYAVSHIIVVKKLHDWIDKAEFITVQNSKVNLLMGNLSIEGIKLTDKKYTTDTCTIESFCIKGFSILDYVFSDRIHMDDLILHSAHFFLSDQMKSGSNDQLKKTFNISRITLDSIDFNYRTEKFRFQANKVRADLTNVTNLNKFQFEDLVINMRESSYKPRNGSHNFLTNRIEFNSIKQQVKIDNFIIQPQCDIEEWPSCYPNKKARSTYSVNSIVAQLDTSRLFKGFFLKELEVNEGLFEVLSYQDMETSDLPKSFFMAQFDNIETPINIPVIKVKNHTVQALLKGENVDTITFSQVYSTIANVTNVPEKLKQNNSIEVNTLSNFMDAKLRVDFDFKIKDPLNAYTFNLSLEPMPFTALNKALYYNSSLVIEDGILQQLDCEVTGDAVTSNGQCTIAYDDLYLRLENKKGGTKKLFTKVLNFIVKDGTSNSETIKPKVFRNTLERDQSKDYFFQTYTIILLIIKEAMLPI